MTSPSLLSLNNKRPAVKRRRGIKLLRPYNPLVTGVAVPMYGTGRLGRAASC